MNFFNGGISIDKLKIYEELKSLNEKLYSPFPYRDTGQIQEDFFIFEDDCLNGDLNSYWMNIVGSLSYVLRGNSKKIPKGQIDRLHLSFYDIFQQYRFLEEKMDAYPIFYQEYKNHEKARKLLLDYLS